MCGSLQSQNSDHFPAQPSLIGFYNRDGECLLRGTSNSIFKAMLCLSHSIKGLSTRTPRFDPRPVHVSVAVVGMALEQVVLRVIGVFAVHMVLTEFNSHHHVHVALTRRSNGQSLSTFPTLLFSK